MCVFKGFAGDFYGVSTHLEGRFDFLKSPKSNPSLKEGLLDFSKSPRSNPAEPRIGELVRQIAARVMRDCLAENQIIDQVTAPHRHQSVPPSDAQAPPRSPTPHFPPSPPSPPPTPPHTFPLQSTLPIPHTPYRKTHADRL